jgi:hypothetical protein
MFPNLLNTLAILQTPTGTPNPGDGNLLDVSDPFELIVYILIPIALLLFYFLYWRRKGNR